MLISIYFLLAVWGIVVRRSKLLTVLLFAFVWVLMWNTSVSDYKAYEFIFKNTGFRDLGYGLLCNMFYKAGFDFLSFKLTLAAASLYLYCRFTLKYVYYNCLVAALYLLFLFQLDVVQFRNFVAFSIVLSAVPFLLKEGFRNKISYIILIAIAATIHASMAFYVVFLLIRKDTFTSLKSIFQNVLVIGLLLFICSYLFTLDVLDRMEQYTKITSILTKVASCVVLFGNLGYIFISRKKEYVLPQKMTKNQWLFIRDPSKTVLYINIALLAILPLVFSSLNYLRLFRFVAILNFAYIAGNIAVARKHKGWRIFLLVLYAFFFFFLVYFMHKETFMDGVVEPIFKKNLLLK